MDFHFSIRKQYSPEGEPLYDVVKPDGTTYAAGLIFEDAEALATELNAEREA